MEPKPLSDAMRRYQEFRAQAQANLKSRYGIDKVDQRDVMKLYGARKKGSDAEKEALRELNAKYAAKAVAPPKTRVRTTKKATAPPAPPAPTRGPRAVSPLSLVESSPDTPVVPVARAPAVPVKKVVEGRVKWANNVRAAAKRYKEELGVAGKVGNVSRFAAAIRRGEGNQFLNTRRVNATARREKANANAAKKAANQAAKNANKTRRAFTRKAYKNNSYQTKFKNAVSKTKRCKKVCEECAKCKEPGAIGSRGSRNYEPSASSVPFAPEFTEGEKGRAEAFFEANTPVNARRPEPIRIPAVREPSASYEQF